MRGVRVPSSAAARSRLGSGQIPSAIIYQRLLITHEPVDDTLPERIVDELMLPLLTGQSPS